MSDIIQSEDVSFKEKKYNISLEAIDKILELFTLNKIGQIKNHVGIPKLDQKKFDNYTDFTVVFTTAQDNVHTFYCKNNNQYLVFIFYLYQKNIDPIFDLFTKNLNDTANVIKKNNYNKTIYFLTLADIEQKRYKEDLKKMEDLTQRSTSKELQVQQKKKQVEDYFNEKMNTLFNKRSTLIDENKTLYKKIKQLSTLNEKVAKNDEKENSNSDSENSNSNNEKENSNSEKTEQKKEKSQDRKYMEEIRELLQNIEKNKNEIIETMKQISILEKLINLYKSETFLYNTTSGLVVREATKEEKEELQNKTKVKKGGELYDLEYLELPETFSWSVESTYGKMKREIKKKSKKEAKSILLSKYKI